MTLNSVLEEHNDSSLASVIPKGGSKDGTLFYSLSSSPMMPPPGPDFRQAAVAIAGENASDETINTWIDYLYFSSLYQIDFQLDVDFKSTKKRVTFIPGHLWTQHGEISYGPQQSDVMIIGKIAGHEEGMYKRNLIGPSGGHLRSTLNEIERNTTQYDDETGEQYEYSQTSIPDVCDSYYVTNLLKHVHPDPRSGIIPAAWIKDALPILHQELRIVRPKYILCLGTEAAQALLGKGVTVTSTANQVFDYNIPLHKNKTDPPIIHTAKLMTCIHPAAVLRSPDLNIQFVESLRFFRFITEGGVIGAKETDISHIVISDAGQLTSIVDSILREPDNNVVAVDCEWEGEYPGEPGSYLRTVQFSHKGKSAYCVVLRLKGGLENPNLPIGTAQLELIRLLKSTPERSVRVVGHFFRSDLQWLLHMGVDVRQEFDAPEDDSVGTQNRRMGWEKTFLEGGFDTGTAAHAVTEAGQSYKLEVLAAQQLGLRRYDTELQAWKKSYCKERGIGAKDLEGYGNCPDETLYPYACYDVDSTRRLFDVYNGTTLDSGLLDCDRYGNNCRKAYWISQRAQLAFLEMELTGILLDKDRADELVKLYSEASDIRLQEFRDLVRWPEFNPESDPERRELLFGERYNRKITPSGAFLRSRPTGAVCLHLDPVTSTGKRKKAWADVLARGEEAEYKPSCDKDTLNTLAEVSQEAGKLRDLRFIRHTLKSVLRKPKCTDEGILEKDEEGHLIYEDGLLSYVCSDNRIRTHIYQTLETGRVSSVRPNLQNCSKSREADYKRILGGLYKYPIRSILRSSPGTVLIEADYSAAEVMMMAVMSNDPQLLDHAKRATLSDKDPNYYDIHSNICVQTFKLNCLPTKDGLKSIGMAHLRTAAKAVFFGYVYGQSAAASARKAKAEGADVTVQETEALMAGLRRMYPYLDQFLDSCRKRVRTHGWMCNSFGRYRRFSYTSDRQAAGEMERQSMNFTIQSGIADAVSRSLDYLYHYRETHNVKYKLIMQIHDAILLEVPYNYVEEACEKVLPECMIHNVPLWMTSLDGTIIQELNGQKTLPKYLGIGIELSEFWGINMTKQRAEELGIPVRLIN